MRVTAEEDGQVNKNSQQAQAPTHKTHVAKPGCRLSKAVYAGGGGGFVGGLGGRDHQRTRQNGDGGANPCQTASQTISHVHAHTCLPSERKSSYLFGAKEQLEYLRKSMSSEPKSSHLTNRAGISFSFLYFLIPKKEKFLVAAGVLGAPDASDEDAASDFAACACKQTTQNLENMKMFEIALLFL